MERPNIHHPRYQDNYRSFIRDMFYYLKEQDSKFSHRNFAKEAGFGSPNFALLLMKGERHLGPDGTVKTARGLRLTPQESTKFFNLVFTSRYTQFCSEWTKARQCPLFPKSEGW